MKFHNATYSQDVVDSKYLGDALNAFPEIKKYLIRQICEENALCLTEKVLGYGRNVTEGQLQDRNKMFLGANELSWAIQPRMRVPLTVAAAPVGTGVGLANITFTFDENWGAAGMVLKFQDVATGDITLVVLTSGPSGAGPYTYTGKLVTGDVTATFPAGVATIGQKIGWNHDIHAACGNDTTSIPLVTFDWYKNYMTIMKPSRIVCRDGIQQVTWIESEGGSRCWQPQEEFQFFQQFLKSFEFAGWHGKTTVDPLTGVVTLTDSAGNQILTGDGVLAQIDSGNVNTYSINTYTNPANYELFRIFIQSNIEDWAIANGLSAGIELDFWCGLKAYSLLQNVLKDYADTSGGCCFVKDYNDGSEYEVALGVNFRRYHWSGFTINLKKCAAFDDPGVNATYVGSSTVPQDSYRFIVMPDSDCNGNPLIQVYFRGGCGIEHAFMHKVIPGSINPLDPQPTSTAASKNDGYETWYQTEFMFVVNDPSKLLLFSGIQP